MRITFEADGGVKFIYDDAALPVAEVVGDVTVRRASHVEPVVDQLFASGVRWEADMSPVGGPVLGPFFTRDEALAAERDWLIDNDVPRPKTFITRPL